jgi:hypothetical protein
LELLDLGLMFVKCPGPHCIAATGPCEAKLFLGIGLLLQHFGLIFLEGDLPERKRS